jgi:hypothetical protein
MTRLRRADAADLTLVATLIATHGWQRCLSQLFLRHDSPSRSPLLAQEESTVFGLTLDLRCTGSQGAFGRH